MTRVLALDVGSSSVRAQVWDDGEPADTAQKVRYEGVDPDEIVRLVRGAIEGRERFVDAVGASCFGHSLLAVDGTGRPLTPLLGWRDTRSGAAAERLARELDPEAVHARTGCHLHTSYWPAKVRWLAEEQPDVFGAAARFVSFADYLYAQLLGREPPSSLSLASGTGLLNLATQTWDAELLEVLRLDPARLSRVSDEPLGEETPWYPAWFDGACSNIGAGCVTARRAALMVGTSGAYRTIHAPDHARPRPGLFLYRLDAQRVLEGGALSDGGNLYAWVRDTLRRASGSLADRDPGAHGLTFLTLLGGERSTGWDPFATGAIAGLTFQTTPLDLCQAALEGVAFRFAEVAELMPEVEEVVATGGALVSDHDWVQIMADALGRPVTLSGVPEASLRGAAVATLERLGVEATPAPLGHVFEPRRDRADAYRSARDRQRELYEATREWRRDRL
jgi:gluconokinase